MAKRVWLVGCVAVLLVAAKAEEATLDLYTALKGMGVNAVITQNVRPPSPYTSSNLEDAQCYTQPSEAWAEWSETSTKRWLGSIRWGTFFEVTLPDACFASGKAFAGKWVRPVGYSLMNCTKNHSAWISRSPAAWDFYGITADGRTNLLVSVTGNTWKSSTDCPNGNERQDFTFPATIAREDYRKFLFIPRDSVQARTNYTSYNFSLACIKIDVALDDAAPETDSLQVLTEGCGEAEFSVPNGTVLTDDATITASPSATTARGSWQPGYKLGVCENGQWVDGEWTAASSYAYTPNAETPARRRIVWSWQQTGYRIAATTRRVIDHVSVSAGEASGSSLDVAPGTQVTVTASPATADDMTAKNEVIENFISANKYSTTYKGFVKPAEFVRWTGDVEGLPEADLTSPTLTFTADRPRTLKAEFKVYWFLTNMNRTPEGSTAKEYCRVMTDGLWTLSTYFAVEYNPTSGFILTSSSNGKGGSCVLEGEGDLVLPERGEMCRMTGPAQSISQVMGADKWAIEWIKNSSFKGACGVTSLVVGTTVSNLESNVFTDNTSLTNLVLKTPNLLKLPNRTAYQATNLISFELHGERVENVDDQSFYGCSALQKLVLETPALKRVGYRFAYGAPLSKTTFVDMNLSSVTNVGSEAFRASDGSDFYHTEFWGTLQMPNVQRIGDRSFYGRVGIEEVVLGTNGNVLASVGQQSFYASYLRKVTLGIDPNIKLDARLGYSYTTGSISNMVFTSDGPAELANGTTNTVGLLFADNANSLIGMPCDLHVYYPKSAPRWAAFVENNKITDDLNITVNKKVVKATSKAPAGTKGVYCLTGEEATTASTNFRAWMIPVKFSDDPLGTLLIFR